MEQNLRKLYRKQEELKIPYQVRVFWAYQKIKMAAQPLICWDIFDFLATAGRCRYLWISRENNYSMSSDNFVGCFLGQIAKENLPPWQSNNRDGTFYLSAWNMTIYAPFATFSRQLLQISHFCFQTMFSTFTRLLFWQKWNNYNSVMAKMCSRVHFTWILGKAEVPIDRP